MCLLNCNSLTRDTVYYVAIFYISINNNIFKVITETTDALICKVVIHVFLAMMYYCWGILVMVYKNRISYSYWKCKGRLM